MTRDEFRPILIHLKTACGVKELSKEECEAYFAALQHLDHRIVDCAAKMAVVSQPFKSMPPISTIAGFCARIASPPEPGFAAFQLALLAVRKYGCDPESPNWHKRSEKALAALPPKVALALRSYGFRAMQDMNPKYESLERERFQKIYAEIEEHQLFQAALPPAVKEMVQALAGGLGMPELKEGP